jgi:hypothetical protein
MKPIPHKFDDFIITREWRDKMDTLRPKFRRAVKARVNRHDRRAARLALRLEAA